MSPAYRQPHSTSTQRALIAILAIASLCGNRPRAAYHPEAYKVLDSFDTSITLHQNAGATTQTQLESQIYRKQEVVEQLLNRLPHDLHVSSPEDTVQILEAFDNAHLSPQWSQRLKTILRNTLIDDDVSLASRLTVASYLRQNPSEEKHAISFLQATPLKLEPATELLRINLASKLIEDGTLDPTAIRAFVPSMKTCLEYYRLQSTETEIIYNQDLVHKIGTLEQPALKAEITAYLQSFDFSNLSRHQEGLVSQLICTVYGERCLNFYDDSIRPFIFQGISHCLKKGEYQIQSKCILGDEFPSFIMNITNDVLPILSAKDTASYINAVSPVMYAIGADAGNDFLYNTYTKFIASNPDRIHNPEIQQTFFELLLDHEEVLSPQLRACLIAASLDQEILANTPHIFADYFYRHGKDDVLYSWLKSSDESRWDPALRQLTQSYKGIQLVLEYAIKEPATLKRESILSRLNQDNALLLLSKKQKETVAKLFTQIDEPRDFPRLAKQVGITLRPYTDSEILQRFHSKDEFEQEMAFYIAQQQQSDVLFPHAIKMAEQLSQNNQSVPYYLLKYLVVFGNRSDAAAIKTILYKLGKLSSVEDLTSILSKESIPAYQSYITPFLSSPNEKEQIAAAKLLYQGGQSKNQQVIETLRQHIRFSQNIDFEVCEILIKEKDPVLLLRLLKNDRLSSLAMSGIIELLHAHFQNPSFRHDLLAKFKTLSEQAHQDQKQAMLSYHAALTKAHTLGIRLPFRFTPDQLQHILANNERLFRGFVIAPLRPVTAMVLATEDWNGAFNTVGDELRSVFRHTDVYAIDVSNDTQALTFLNRVGMNRNGLDLAIIGGHGSRGMLSFSEEDPRLAQVNQSTKTLDVNDRGIITRYVRPAVNPNGTCLLLSCSVGSEKSSSKQASGTIGAKQGFSTNLVEATAAGMPGVSVYGAIKPISTGDIRFDFRQGQLERIGPGSILYNVKAKK